MNIKDSKILIIDDEMELLSLLEKTLSKEGFKRIYTASNGQEALTIFEEEEPDLIILDVMLPDIEGYDICKIIRKTSQVPILFLSAKGEEIDRVMGLVIGADDYITKPFSLKEVVLRVNIQLKKGLMVNEIKEYEGKQNNDKILCGPFEIDDKKVEVKKNNKVIDLTAKEYKMFLYMMRHINQIISKEKFCNEVWGEDFIGFDNTIMVHIRKLREKLEDNPSKPRHIVNVKGLGYKLVCKE